MDEVKYTIERSFERHGGKVELIHTLELAQSYLCTCRLPGKSEESSLCYLTNDFKLAHEQYSHFVNILKNVNY